MSTAKVWVRSGSMKDYNGIISHLELGQVFVMQNEINDGKLLELGYLIPVDSDTESGIVTCIGCNKEFIGAGYRNSHAERAQHEVIEVDGPQLKQPGRGIDPSASGSDRELEPVGAPAPTPPHGDLAVDRGSKATSGSGSRKADEVFRL